MFTWKSCLNSDGFSIDYLDIYMATCNFSGKISFTWLGPAPAVILFDSEPVKDVFTKNYIYQKPPTNPQTKLLTLGLGTLDTEKWAKHRRLVNPAFHLEKLKVNLIFSLELECYFNL